MRFLCDACQAKYEIPDAVVAGERVSMRCRSCDHVIVIDGRNRLRPPHGHNASSLDRIVPPPLPPPPPPSPVRSTPSSPTAALSPSPGPLPPPSEPLFQEPVVAAKPTAPKRRRRVVLAIATIALLGLAAAAVAVVMDATKRRKAPIAVADAAVVRDLPLAGELRFAALGGPLWLPTGVSPLSEQESATQLHFRVVVDNGRVLKVAETTPDGVALERRSYDYAPSGELVAIEETDPYGTLVARTTFEAGSYRRVLRSGANGLEGCDSMAFSWDRHVATHSCLGRERTPVVGAVGVGAVKQDEYDTRLLLVRSVTDGVETRFSYDATGRLQRHLADQLQPSNGCAGTELVYDAFGYVVERRCLGLGGALARDLRRVASEKIRRDPQHCPTHIEYFDKDGLRTARPDGVAIELVASNGLCSPVGRSVLNLDDRPLPVPGEGGAFAVYWLRSPTGDILEERYLDGEGKPTAGGACRTFTRRFKRDPLGRPLRIEFRDSADKPAPCGGSGPRGLAVDQVWSEHGQLLEQRPVRDDSLRCPSCVGSWSFRYDADGVLVERTAKGTGGMPLFLEAWSHDTAGRVTEVRLLDDDRHPVEAQFESAFHDLPSRPWHRVAFARDAAGFRLRDDYFDTRGDPVGTVHCASRRCWDSP